MLECVSAYETSTAYHPTSQSAKRVTLTMSRRLACPTTGGRISRLLPSDQFRFAKLNRSGRVDSATTTRQTTMGAIDGKSPVYHLR